MSLTHIDCHMDDVISVLQGWGEQQHQFFDSTVHALKWLFSSQPGEDKDLVSVKNLLARKGYWECFKEVIGWIIDTKAGTVTLP